MAQPGLPNAGNRRMGYGMALAPKISVLRKTSAPAGAVGLAAILVVVYLAPGTADSPATAAQSRTDQPVETAVLPARALQFPAVPRQKRNALAVIVKKDTVIGIRLDRTLASDSARVDDKVTARVARDVVVDGRTAIPADARLEGIVVLVERGSPAGHPSRLGIRFTTLVLAGNNRVPVETDTIFRGRDAAGAPATSLGASAALGSMLSDRGRQGVVNPSGTGARAGPNPHDARIPAGSPLTVKLTAELSIAIERDKRRP